VHVPSLVSLTSVAVALGPGHTNIRSAT